MEDHVEYDFMLAQEQRIEARLHAGQRTPKDGFVYLIHATGTPYYKIGKTKDPRRRTKWFQLKLPFPIRVVHIFPSANMDKTERDLHERFKDQRVNGEWFDLSLKDVAWISWIDEVDEGVA